jgi:hypothetical protein
MRLDKIFSVLPVAAFLAVAALPVQAQGSFGFGFSKFGRKSGFSVGFNTGPVYHGHYHGGIVVEPARHWVPGHWDTRAVQVWVPGRVRTVYVEPQYETIVDPCGHLTRVLVREGYTRTYQEPGCYETRYERVWVPGYWI